MLVREVIGQIDTIDLYVPNFPYLFCEIPTLDYVMLGSWGSNYWFG